MKVAAALVVGVAVVGIATWAFAGPAGAHPGMSCNPAPGHGSPGCHVDAATTTTTVAATTTTQASTTTTKRTTTTAKPSTPTTKPSTGTTKPSTSTTKPGTSTTGSSTTTAATAGATPSTDGAATTTTGAGSTTTVSVAEPEAAAPSGAEPGTVTPATDIISWNCNKCHEGVDPDFAAALPGHVHANPDAVRAVYETKVAFSILTGSILAAGMFIVATSISLRGLARHRRKVALRKKGL